MNGAEVGVIRCAERHLETIRAIYNDAIVNTTALYEYHPRSAEVVATWWDGKCRAGLPVLGIEAADGTLAGFATWGPFRSFPAYKYTAEHSVYVGSAHRGRGVGRRLLTALVAEATARELHLLVGGIDADNAASKALHRAAGFTLAGTVRQAGFKFGRWLDLEFWQRYLPGPPQPVDG
ncbi:MAG: N-acetyltransferase family protein [Planctomycetia bacterium]|nr:N-acetyltransferase family protein [Planctomycetia bacterium]